MSVVTGNPHKSPTSVLFVEFTLLLDYLPIWYFSTYNESKI